MKNLALEGTPNRIECCVFSKHLLRISLKSPEIKDFLDEVEDSRAAPPT